MSGGVDLTPRARAAGRLAHKDQVHEGLHAPIVDHERWNRVQRQLAEHAPNRAGSRHDSYAWLAGKLFDDRGNRMSPSHATKRGRRYRYYVSRAILHGRKEDVGSVARVPALELERRVVDAVRGAAPSDPRTRSIETQNMHRVSDLGGGAGWHVRVNVAKAGLHNYLADQRCRLSFKNFRGWRSTRLPDCA
jgi:hypothetical protein